MVTEELLTYIKRQKKNGVPDESVRDILLSNGWLKQDVEKAFGKIAEELNPPAQIVKAEDLHSKIEMNRPSGSIQSQFRTLNQGMQNQFQGNAPIELNPVSNPALNDSYREPLTNEAHVASVGSMGSSLGAGVGLPDDIKDRLRKISQGSMFNNSSQGQTLPSQQYSSPEEIHPQMASVVESKQGMPSIDKVIEGGVMPSRELIDSVAGGNGASFMERLSAHASVDKTTLSQQPEASLHTIGEHETSPLDVNKPNPNRLYGNMNAMSPYSPSVDHFQMRPETQIAKKGGGLKIFLVVLVLLGAVVEGVYYVSVHQPQLLGPFAGTISGLREKITGVQNATDSTKEENTQTAQNQEIPVQNSNPVTSPVNQNAAPSPQVTQTQPSSLPTSPALSSTLEAELKATASKVSSYVGVKATMKGVCSNISSGIARDVLGLKNTYGATTTCIDAVNGFMVSAPMGNQFMCIDAKQEVLLLGAVPKSASCAQ